MARQRRGLLSAAPQPPAAVGTVGIAYPAASAAPGSGVVVGEPTGLRVVLYSEAGGATPVPLLLLLLLLADDVLPPPPDA